MDDFGWDHDLSAHRSTDVHRRLTIDRRNYDVVAYCGVDGLVGLRVTGWDAGYVVTEMAGEIPAVDAFDVGNLIAATLGGFRWFTPPEDVAPNGPPPQDWWAVQRAAAPNAGKPWEPQDLELLLARFEEGASVKSLTAELGRTEGGIRSRLQMLGVTRPDPAGAEPPEGRPEGRPEGPADAPAEGGGEGRAERGPGASAERGGEGPAEPGPGASVERGSGEAGGAEGPMPLAG